MQHAQQSMSSLAIRAINLWLSNSIRARAEPMDKTQSGTHSALLIAFMFGIRALPGQLHSSRVWMSAVLFILRSSSKGTERKANVFQASRVASMLSCLYGQVPTSRLLTASLETSVSRIASHSKHGPRSKLLARLS